MQDLGFYRLFPELTLKKDGFSTDVSKWFGRYKNRVLTCDNKDKKTFHSFRHLFLNNLGNNDVEENIIEYLAGHSRENKNRLHKSYKDTPELPILYKAIQTITSKIPPLHNEYNDISDNLITLISSMVKKDPELTNPKYFLEQEIIKHIMMALKSEQRRKQREKEKAIRIR
jgi:hypothetical protein